ncbi:MAG: PIN domain-containing protein [Chloroflexi bacterium]|nr:PIN domain-containing protein [Chloroflexota bacterium]
MNNGLLLDTNAMIARLKGDNGVIQVLATEDVWVSSTVIGELYFGAYKSGRVEENIRNLEAFIHGRTILVCDKDTAHIYGRIRHQLQVKGRPIPQNDVWIAAVALQHNLTLLTRDVHFKEVDNLPLKSW